MIRIGRQIVAGSATVDLSEYLKSNVPNSNVWIGSEAEYEELSDIVKNDTKITFITYEDESAVSWIVDNVISYSKTWSSVKISTQLANKLNASQAYTKSEVDALLNAKLSSVYKYCGKVASASYLPSGASNGDLYFVADESVNYVWNAEDSQWDKMSSLVDLTNYITTAGLEAILANYAEKFQFVTMPTASATYEDKVVQFIGDTTAEFTKGSFYQCQNNSGTYSWANLSICRAAITQYDNTSSGLTATNVQAAIDEAYKLKDARRLIISNSDVNVEEDYYYAATNSLDLVVELMHRIQNECNTAGKPYAYVGHLTAYTTDETDNPNIGVSSFIASTATGANGKFYVRMKILADDGKLYSANLDQTGTSFELTRVDNGLYNIQLNNITIPANDFYSVNLSSYDVPASSSKPWIAFVYNRNAIGDVVLTGDGGTLLIYNNSNSAQTGNLSLAILVKS